MNLFDESISKLNKIKELYNQIIEMDLAWRLSNKPEKEFRLHIKQIHFMFTDSKLLTNNGVNVDYFDLILKYIKDHHLNDDLVYVNILKKSHRLYLEYNIKLRVKVTKPYDTYIQYIHSSSILDTLECINIDIVNIYIKELEQLREEWQQLIKL